MSAPTLAEVEAAIDSVPDDDGLIAVDASSDGMRKLASRPSAPGGGAKLIVFNPEGLGVEPSWTPERDGAKRPQVAADARKARRVVQQEGPSEPSPDGSQRSEPTAEAPTPPSPETGPVKARPAGPTGPRFQVIRQS